MGVEPDASTPLLDRKSERNHKYLHIMAGLVVFAVLVTLLSLLQARRAGSSSKRQDSTTVVPRDAPLSSWPPPSVVANEWNAGENGKSSSATQKVQEHYVFSTGVDDLGNSAHIFLKQSYTYWRYGLNGPRAMRQPGARRIEVESFRYNDRDALLHALEERRLSAGALVFISVTTMALECELRDYDALTNAPYNLEPSQIVTDVPQHSSRVTQILRAQSIAEPIKLESLCVYIHTPDLFLRSRLLRELFAYPKPLVLFLAGDSACRLKQLPKTHHAIVFPNDGAPSRAEGDVMWFPEGLEGLETGVDRFFWRSTAEANAFTLTDAPALPLQDRPFLFDCGMSVNGRKPSRISLIQYLESGGADQLRTLASDSGLAMRINASVIDMPVGDGDNVQYSDEYRQVHFQYGIGLEDLEGGDAHAVFALAPAGDTWSSGRTLEAMLMGAIPVVDMTYVSDRGASSKGCDDAAAFWRDGVRELRGAPFVFIENWHTLPDALRAFGATNATQLEARLDAVQEYRDDLEAYLRNSILDFSLARQTSALGVFNQTRCSTTHLDGPQLQAQLDAERDYYTSDWLERFVDRPDYPTGACTNTFHTQGEHIRGSPIIPHYDAPCYDAVCAPNLVHSFECTEL